LIVEDFAKLRELEHSGWLEINSNAESEGGLIEQSRSIAGVLGCVVRGPRRQFVEHLRPIGSDHARPASLSKKYGLGVFPIHCDTAHWLTPARYVVLSCVHPGETDQATVILDTSSLEFSPSEDDLARSAVFVVKNGRRSFYTTIVAQSREFVRIDRGCMEPVDDRGVDAFDLYDGARWSNKLVRVSWQVGKILLIDNWRMLHGRGATEGANSNRRLIRILVQ
jgi:hypothetical protein